MAEEESLEARQNVQGLKDVVRSSAANTVILEAHRLQVSLISEHDTELTHRIVVQVIIVQEDLLQCCDLDEGARDGLETRIANQV